MLYSFCIHASIVTALCQVKCMTNNLASKIYLPFTKNVIFNIKNKISKYFIRT